MNSPISQARPADDSRERLQHLSAIAERLLERCKAAGASQAEVSCNEDTGLAVNVRMGEVETVEATRDRGIAVTVYFGARKRQLAFLAKQMRRQDDETLDAIRDALSKDSDATRRETAALHRGHRVLRRAQGQRQHRGPAR